MACWIVEAWTPWNRCQRGRLGEIELARGLVEVGFAGHSEPPEVGAKMDAIQVFFQDFWLAERAFDAQCQQGLLELPEHAGGACEE